ncbi:MAG: DUF4199 family protein [bacterium]|nr:DUF4199 family protein [bacterium]
MSKKILIYGLAFGSACAALEYLFYTNGIYKDMGLTRFLVMLSEYILIPVFGIFVFIKSYRDSNPEQFVLGKVVFMGFFVSIIIGSSISLLFSYLVQFKPFYINDAIAFYENQFKASKAGLKRTPEEMKTALENIKYNFSASQQFIFHLFLGGSRGLFFSAIFGYFLRPKNTTPAN